MHHSFDVEIAKRYGMLEAVLINNFEYWIEYNRANDINFFDGKFWTYNSVTALMELFPYASRKQIRGALDRLRAAEIIQTGNYSDDHMNRALWYTFTDKGENLIRVLRDDVAEDGECICPERHADLPKKANDIYSNIYKYNKTDINNKYKQDKEKEIIQRKRNDYQGIVDLYNDTCISLPKVTRLSDARKNAIKAVLKKYTLGDLQTAFEKVEASDFLTGRAKNGWKNANFDWIMKDANLTKILDGNYDDKKNPGGARYDWSKI